MIHQVALVANQKENGVLLSVSFYFVHPKFANVFKADGICEIEDEEDALAASVVGAGDSPEAFLPCGVPNLKLNVFAVYLYGFEAEVYSDGGKVVFWELIFDEADKDGRLADAWVADDDSFVEMVELFYHVNIYQLYLVHSPIVSWVQNKPQPISAKRDAKSVEAGSRYSWEDNLSEAEMCAESKLKPLQINR